MKSGLLRSLLSAVALSAGACTGGVRINEPVFLQAYQDGDLEYAARRGVLRTRIFGAPYRGDAASFHDTVSGHMKGANRGPVVEYATGAAGAKSGPYHVVVVFNPEPGAPAGLLCKSPELIGTSPAGPTLKLLAGFCIDDALLSTVEGSADNIPGPAAPGFRQLVRAVTLSLFPAHDFRDDGEIRPPPP